MIRTNTELLEYVEEKHSSTNYFALEEIRVGDTMIYQDKYCSYAFIIKKGIAKCYLTAESGDDFLQELFSKGKLFGEVEIINQNKAFCTIEALSKMIVYKISRQNFYELLENDKKFNNLILKSFAEKIHYKALRHSFNQLNSISTNLLRLKETMDLSLIGSISKQDVANYLGISLRSLNRVLKEEKFKHFNSMFNCSQG